MNLKDIQKKELEILKAVHDFCDNNKLRYFLAYGTLLGAIRHKGFIPWDNDIDILMPRPDYEKLLDITKNQEIGKGLYVEHYTTDPKYHYMCIRVCDKTTKVYVPYIREQPSNLGLWVDIFPLDGVPSFFFIRVLQRCLSFFYWILFRADVYGCKRNNSKTLLHLFIKKSLITLNPNKNNSNNYMIDKICSWESFDKASKVGMIFDETGLFVTDKSNFAQPSLKQFEQYFFYVPQNYDLILKQWYGNYMELPKTEDRITHDIDVQEV